MQARMRMRARGGDHVPRAARADGAMLPIARHPGGVGGGGGKKVPAVRVVDPLLRHAICRLP